jgi:hypothetical protein
MLNLMAAAAISMNVSLTTTTAIAMPIASILSEDTHASAARGTEGTASDADQPTEDQILIHQYKLLVNENTKKSKISSQTTQK